MSEPYISNYDKHPVVHVSDSRDDCEVGWQAVGQRLKASVRPGRFVMCVECYPGCFEKEIEKQLVRALEPQIVLRAGDCYLPESAIQSLCARDLGDDPVFAFMGKYELSDFLDERELAKQKSRLRQASGLALVIGTGATLLAEEWDLLVYCDMARWEIQQRQRAGEITNLGLQNCAERPQAKYKRAFFVRLARRGPLEKNADF